MADGWEDNTGPEGIGHVTDIGERLLNLWAANGLKDGGGLFWHKNIHRWTDCKQLLRCGSVLAAVWWDSSEETLVVTDTSWSPADVHIPHPWSQHHRWPDETWREERSSRSDCVWTSPLCRPVSASTPGFHACTWQHTGPARESDLCHHLFSCITTSITHTHTHTHTHTLLKHRQISRPTLSMSRNSHDPSVLWHCWLVGQQEGHQEHKIAASETFEGPSQPGVLSGKTDRNWRSVSEMWPSQSEDCTAKW